MAREVPFMFLGSNYEFNAMGTDVYDFRITPKLDTFDFRWTELR